MLTFTSQKEIHGGWGGGGWIAQEKAHGGMTFNFEYLGKFEDMLKTESGHLTWE